MTLVDLPTLSDERMGGFYVPRFEIAIEGANLPQNVVRDVIQVTYKDNIKEIDSVELTINNWEPASNAFKYAGAETAEDLAGDDDEFRRYKLFEPCRKQFGLSMGYEPELTLMMNGHFTTMEPVFPASGASTLTVRGLNVLHKLRRKQFTTSWETKKDSEVARNIATLRDEGERRFELPIEIDEEAMAEEPTLDYLAQENQYDVDFLLYRARVRGYVFVYYSEGSDRNPEEHVYFGPSAAGRVDEIYELEWGKSLIDFTPTLTTANQVKSVTVNGWDRHRKRAISEKAELSDLEENRDLDRILEECDAREEIVVNRPVFSQEDARRTALALLRDRHKEMVKATGSTIGLPNLRAGRKIQINGLGARFSGTYFVTESTHTINDKGYLTKFKARREDESGYTEAVQ